MSVAIDTDAAQLAELIRPFARLGREDVSYAGGMDANLGDYCRGCGICVAECPCGAIEMVPETI